MMIETSRLVLREYTLADVPTLHRILSDPLTMQFWPTPFMESDTERWLRRAMTSYETNGFGRWAVLLRGTKEQIGDAGLMRTEVNGKTEIDLGYIIHADHWRKGYGFEAAEASLQYGARIGEKRMVANMAFNNIRSQHVAERLGMKKELEFENPKNRGIRTFLYVY